MLDIIEQQRIEEEDRREFEIKTLENLLFELEHINQLKEIIIDMIPNDLADLKEIEKEDINNYLQIIKEQLYILNEHRNNVSLYQIVFAGNGCKRMNGHEIKVMELKIKLNAEELKEIKVDSLYRILCDVNSIEPYAPI